LGRDADKLLSPLVHHFAAASYARLDNTREAKRLWNKVLSQDRHMPLAEDNLGDIQLPVGMRNGAWHFPFQQWVNRDWILRLERLFRSSASRRSDKLQKDFERAFEAIPALKTTLILLDRGDPVGREFALQVGTLPTAGTT
jgi:hypothetical protein